MNDLQSEIEIKFEKGKEKNTYQRVGYKCKADIYLGYNEESRISMVIFENALIDSVSSTKVIKVEKRMRKDGKISLEFELMNEGYKPIFILFCKDIIEVCSNQVPGKAIKKAILRWNYWKHMFSAERIKKLTKKEVKGLIGELLELERLIEEIGEEKAVSSWIGALGGHKDFELEDTWYEVKCIDESSSEVKISSLEQLESMEIGHLVIYKLNDTSSLNYYGVNLNQLVFRIVGKIENPEIKEDILIKLENVGYEFNEGYNEYTFLVIDRCSYIVSEEFPKIRREQIDEAIGKVQYSLIINGIKNFKEE